MSKNKPIGKATLKIGSKKIPFLVDVYGYEKHRTIFISNKIRKEVNKSIEQMPKYASVENYLGRWSYRATKFGNPNNRIPSYDFQVKS